MHISERILDESSHKAGYQKTQTHKAQESRIKALCRIDQHVISNPQEKMAIKQLINAWTSNDNYNWSLPVKKIICLARAVLEGPKILLVEEKALIIDQSRPLDYLDGVFEALDQTTVLCEVTAFRLFDRFDRTAVFDEKTIVEQDLTLNLLANKDSSLRRVMKSIDSRFIGDTSPRSKS